MRGALGFGKHKRGDKHDKHGTLPSSEEVSSAEHSPRDKNVTFSTPSPNNTPVPGTPTSDTPISAQSTPGRLDNKPHLKLILPRQEQIKAEEHLETRARSASEPQGRDEEKEPLPTRNSQDMPRGQGSSGQILLTCRICENAFTSDQLAKHSEYCLLANQYDVRLSSCDARLEKV